MDAIREKLIETRKQLKAAHRKGAGGYEVAGRMAAFWDRTLATLFEAAGGPKAGLTLWTTGSLGRRDPSIYSDVDFLLLAPDDVSDAIIEPIAEAMLYPLWDAKAKTGHRVHRVSAALQLGRDDPEGLSTLIDARFVAGDKTAAAAFSERVDQLLAEPNLPPLRRQTAPPTHPDYPPSVHVLEPDVKESLGGLRDYHLAVWRAKVRYGRRGWIDALIENKVHSRIGWAELEGAVDLLLRLRHELHFQAKGPSDTLIASLQPEIAGHLGYQGAGEAEGAKALLKDYFFVADRIIRFGRRVDEAIGGGDFTTRDDIVPGATANGDLLRLPKDLELHDAPAVFELFGRLAGTGMELTERTRARLSILATIVDDDTRDDPDAASAFMKLLDKDRAADSLRGLHSIHVLDAYVPQFGRLRGLVPYDVFHSYPADEHTLLAEEFFDRLLMGIGPEPLPEIAASLARRDLLRLAILLHDTGKVGGPGHKERGARMAPIACLRLNLSPQETEFVVRLVREHESLSHAAHTRDVEDPVVSRELAEKFSDVESLNALYVLTYCDMRAVGPGVWTRWRGRLIETLYNRALSFLQRGSLALDRNEQFNAIAEAIQGLASEKVVEGYLTQMQRRRPAWLSPERARQHVEALAKFDETSAPVVMLHETDQEEGDYAVMCAQDRPGLFATAAALLASERISVLDVQAFVNEDGVALDTFHIVNRNPSDDRQALTERLTSTLGEILSGRKTVEEVLAKSERRFGLRDTQAHIATEVRLDNHASGKETVVEVWTADRPFLLYRITKALFEFGVSIRQAKVNTIAGRAIDAFYIVDAQGHQITGQHAQALRAKLHAELG